ncbi:MAG: hypothetical protein ACRDRD_19365, partial [Pseudonocardiaceae bacterium]
SRDAGANVSGADPHYTPAGERPIQPVRIKVHYYRGTARYPGWIGVEVAGMPVGGNPAHPCITRRMAYEATGCPRQFADEHRPDWLPQGSEQRGPR